MEDLNQIQEQTPQTEESNNTFSFVSDEEVQQLSQPQYQQVEQVEEVDEAVPQDANEYVEPQQEQQQETYQNSVDYSDEDVEGAVLNFLSERLGTKIDSFDNLLSSQERSFDERVLAIADFVEKTGRDPQDWFYYQSLNPSEMDDMTAIQVEMASSYPNLSQDEIGMLLQSKYKLDASMYSEDDVKLAQLQLKIDSENARKNIQSIRDEFAAPEVSEQPAQESIINDEWIAEMRRELDDLESIEFDLGNGKSFNFGLEDSYKSDLASKNARLDEFFDSYVRQDGSWDFDKLNIHRAAIDNIDKIVQSAYRQGMSDGQRGIVDRSANVSSKSPQVGNNQPDPISQQLREALGANQGMRFL